MVSLGAEQTAWPVADLRLVGGAAVPLQMWFDGLSRDESGVLRTWLACPPVDVGEALVLGVAVRLLPARTVIRVQLVPIAACRWCSAGQPADPWCPGWVHPCFFQS